MPLLLAQPVAKCFLGFCQRKGIGIQHNGGVVFIGDFMNEEIVISAGNMIDGGEALVIYEELTLVG